MKTFKLYPVAAFCVTAAILLSSCGIMKNNDFSSQKYTNFKKGEAAINYKKADNEKKEVASFTAVSSKEEISEISNTAANEPTQTVLNSTQKIKIESNNNASSNRINPKEIEKVKINRGTHFGLKRLVNKANTASVSGGDISDLVLIILAILIPPLAVFLAMGICQEFWIDLILAILVVLYPVAIIYALIVIFGR